jgi:hypothetical protein
MTFIFYGSRLELFISIISIESNQYVKLFMPLTFVKNLVLSIKISFESEQTNFMILHYT